jgi:CubicO group peptidase (beta-lactamase class C family)
MADIARHLRTRRLLGGLLAVLMSAASAAAQQLSSGGATIISELDATTRARIDTVFAAYDRTDTPGCALLVRRNGATVHARGYGMASLELGVPITPRTVMDIGSTSKQFTAASIWLLAQEGKLSLDDEIQKYLPDLPRLGPGEANRVTIRHLLQHTSGWRDYTELMSLAGLQEEAVTTADDAMAALKRQRGGNFAPGTSWAYSNTGYFLLSQIVERVSGMSMREFLRARIFTPLGMTHSEVFDDHARLYPGRASSYTPGAQGWRVAASNWEQTGDGAIQTSVEDLARWDANFDAPVVGGQALVDSMQRSGRLVTGAPIAYAYGLFIDRFRGVPRVQHGGAWAGYRAMTMRFPAQHASVTLTCNAANANTGLLAEGVATALLGNTLGPSEAERLRDSLVAPSRATRTAIQGLWWDPAGGRVLRVALQDTVAVLGSAVGGPQRPLAQLPDGWLVTTPVQDAGSRFRLNAASGRLLLRSADGLTTPLERVTRGAAPTAEQRAAYAGQYANPEIPGAWEIAVRRDTLWLSLPGARPSALQPIFDDAFRSADGVIVRILRDARGRVTALGFTSRGLRDVRWSRVAAGESGEKERGATRSSAHP